jgi:hypothetical protein
MFKIIIFKILYFIVIQDHSIVGFEVNVNSYGP